MSFRCLFHVHTHRSFDSLLSPRKVLERARELGADVLIVTDHNTIQGSRELQRLAKGGPPRVVAAAEYQSEKGDIIGVFLREEIHTRRSAEILEQIHSQGGLAVLPHPFRGHSLDDALLAGVDLIEVHNSRCSDSDNSRGAQLALDWNRPVLAGADAHCSWELGSALNELLTEVPVSDSDLQAQLLRAPRRMITQRTPALCRPYSQMVKAVRTRNPGLFLYQAKRMALTLGRGERQ